VESFAFRSSGETLVCFGPQSLLCGISSTRAAIYILYLWWCRGREEGVAARNHIVVFIYLLDIPADDSHRVMEGE
jgi:hypothetical protein